MYSCPTKNSPYFTKLALHVAHYVVNTICQKIKAYNFIFYNKNGRFVIVNSKQTRKTWNIKCSFTPVISHFLPIEIDGFEFGNREKRKIYL